MIDAFPRLLKVSLLEAFSLYINSYYFCFGDYIEIQFFLVYQ